MGRGRPPHPDVLTPAEWRVLEQVRAGRANAEIAVRLGVSVSTVRYHLGNILSKLELPDRAAMVVWDGEPRRVRMAAPVLWLLARLGSVGNLGWPSAGFAGGVMAAAVAVVAATVVIAGGFASAAEWSEPSQDAGWRGALNLGEWPEPTAVPEPTEGSPAERAARVSARFAASDEGKGCFFVRYWSDGSGQLVLTDAMLAFLGVGSTGGCGSLLSIGSIAPVLPTEPIVAERTADDSPTERASRVAIEQAARPRYTSRSFIDACAVLGDAPPVVASARRALDQAQLPEFEVSEDGCIVLPDPALLDPLRPLMSGGALSTTLPVEACLIQYVVLQNGNVSRTVPSASEGSFPIEITESCGFVPVGGVGES